MQIQRVEFPSDVKQNTIELYMRCVSGRYELKHGELWLATESCVRFNSYINIFSAEKWLQYTILDDLSFSFLGKGRFWVRIYKEYQKEKGNLYRELLAETHVEVPGADAEQIVIPIRIQDCQGGVLYVELEAGKESGGVFAEGAFVTGKAAPRTVSMVLDICTYRREQFLFENLKVLRESLWDNPKSCMYHNFFVMIADNGQTVPGDWEADWISIYPNRNAGGVAGFTRIMLEAMEQKRFSHILLMDDDIEIMPFAVERTYVLLRFLKEEYQNAMIGGAMLRRDYPFIQQEAGGCYRNGKVISQRCGLDMRVEENVVYNECIDTPDYNAWWYCCMPLDLIERKGLPLPLFIHDDDIEYGLRCRTEVILLNGICVRHESFEHKRPSVNEYYDVRNTLIINAVHDSTYSVGVALKMIYRRMITNLFRYRYRDMRLVKRAVEDFLKGPKWLMEQDAYELHEKLRNFGYSYQENYKDELPDKERVRLEAILTGRSNCNQLDKKKLMTFNGWLLPVERQQKAKPIMAGESPHEYYRQKSVFIYDPDTKRGFYSKKCVGELFVLAGSMIKIAVLMQRHYKHARQAYNMHAETMCTKQFWKYYLRLEGEQK